jgi:hypothetical protein
MLSMNVGNLCYKQRKDKGPETRYMNFKLSIMQLIILLPSILLETPRQQGPSKQAISKMILGEVTK